MQQPGTPAIFVHARANIKRRRIDVPFAAILLLEDQHIATSILRPRLNPKQITLVPDRRGEAYRVRNDEITRDWRMPGTKRCFHRIVLDGLAVSRSGLRGPGRFE